MAIHELKTDTKAFSMSRHGLKDYEIRFNDRDFKIGDELHLRETVCSGARMELGSPLEYTGSILVRLVVEVLDGYGLKDGWVILSVRKI